MISYPDGIIPDYGLTGPNNSYIFISVEHPVRIKLTSSRLQMKLTNNQTTGGDLKN